MNIEVDGKLYTIGCMCDGPGHRTDIRYFTKINNENVFLDNVMLYNVHNDASLYSPLEAVNKMKELREHLKRNIEEVIINL
jgi:hypothetical protein